MDINMTTKKATSGSFRKGCESAFKGRKHSEESKLKMSKKQKGKIAWNKGICTYTKEREKEVKRQYYLQNRDKILARMKMPDKILYKKQWKKNNKDKIRIMNNNRRKGVSTLTLETIQRVYEDNIKKYGTLTCYLCFDPIPFKKDHLEHKTPLSRGGSSLYENLDVACQSCNCKKHNKTLEEYRKAV